MNKRPVVSPVHDDSHAAYVQHSDEGTYSCLLCNMQGVLDENSALRARLDVYEKTLQPAAEDLVNGQPDEPHPGHPTGWFESEPYCHACSPRVTWAQVWALRVALEAVKEQT